MASAAIISRRSGISAAEMVRGASTSGMADNHTAPDSDAIKQINGILRDHQSAAVAQRIGRFRARRSKPAKPRRDCPETPFAQSPGERGEAQRIIGPPVQKEHGNPVGWSVFELGDVENIRLQSFHLSCSPVREGRPLRGIALMTKVTRRGSDLSCVAKALADRPTSFQVCPEFHEGSAS
jgi:hypothetical protein